MISKTTYVEKRANTSFSMHLVRTERQQTSPAFLKLWRIADSTVNSALDQYAANNKVVDKIIHFEKMPKLRSKITSA